MPHFVRRLFGGTKHEVRRPPATITPPGSADHDLTLQRLQPYLTQGSQTRGRATDMPSGDVGRHEQREAARHLNERIAAILNAAEGAADDVRRRAQEEAERTRNVAQQQAAADAEEARRRLEEERGGLEELRAELDQRQLELDDEAETYRQMKRREAEAAAAEIRLAAEETTKRAEGDSLVFQRWLEETIPRFHELTDWLDRVRADAPRTEPEAQDVEETLREQLRAKARADL
jgi:hypothetical protein